MSAEDRKRRRKQRRKERNRRRAESHPAHPRFWPTWAGLGLLRVMALIPIPVLGAVADGLGTLGWALMPARRHVVRVNLATAFPDKPEKERRRLERGAFRAGLRGGIEGAISWWASERRLARRYTIEGLEHLEAAREQGKGIILLGGHYTTLEISGRLLRRHVPDLYPTYKAATNPVFDRVMVSQRQKLFAGLPESRDMRAMLRALKRGGVVWYAPDQDFGRKRSVFAPFMGTQAATVPMTGRIAKTSGAPVVPFYSERRPGNRWHLRLAPALEDFPSGDDVEDARRINAAIEDEVRRTPDQYLWLHARYRTRPQGEPPIY